mgnify:CR=1 FL=1
MQGSCQFEDFKDQWVLLVQKKCCFWTTYKLSFSQSTLLKLPPITGCLKTGNGEGNGNLCDFPEKWEWS